MMNDYRNVFNSAGHIEYEFLLRVVLKTNTIALDWKLMN